jgi:hypothetical protein
MLFECCELTRTKTGVNRFDGFNGNQQVERQ